MTTVDPRADLSALHGPDGSGLKFLVGQYISLMKPRKRPSWISVAGLPNHSPAMLASCKRTVSTPRSTVIVPALAE